MQLITINRLTALVFLQGNISNFHVQSNIFFLLFS